MISYKQLTEIAHSYHTVKAQAKKKTNTDRFGGMAKF